MPRQVIVVEKNPNDTSGGGGCACGIRRTTDTRPPYVVFPLTDMDDVMSPHNVVCGHCLELANRAIEEANVQAGAEAAQPPKPPDHASRVESDSPPPASVPDPADADDIREEFETVSDPEFEVVSPAADALPEV